MVTGMDTFRRHFSGFEDSFVVIGGAACDAWFTRFSGQFRATKDIDIILVLEARHPGFFARFWDFIRAGAYAVGQRGDGRCTLFRFLNPATIDYPRMIEVFSSAPTGIEVPPGQTIVHLPADEGASSLSAILLDPAYYGFVLEQREVVDGLPLIRPSGLIPLKARAWLDLTRRRNEGDTSIKGVDISKHRTDVFRLATLLPVGESLPVPAVIAQDMQSFLAAFPPTAGEWRAISASLAATGIRIPPDALIGSLRQFFGVARLSIYPFIRIEGQIFSGERLRRRDQPDRSGHNGCGAFTT